MKLFPFDPAKAQTITNPDGFPVYHHEMGRVLETTVFENGSVAALLESQEVPWGYTKFGANQYLRLGPKPGKTVYLNCWQDEVGQLLWNGYEREGLAKDIAIANPQLKYHYIAIPVVGPEIEP